MKLFLFLIRNSKYTMLTAVCFGLLSGATSALLLRTIHAAVDPELAAQGDLMRRFVLLTIAYLIVVLGSQIPLFYLSENAVYDLRLGMIRKILDARLRFLEEQGKHRLYASLSSDIGMIAQGLVTVPRIIVNLATVLGCTIYLASISVKVLFALLLFVAVMGVAIKLASGRAQRRFAKAREIGDELFAQFRDVTEGIKELKLHAARRESFLADLLRPSAENYRSQRIAGQVQMEIAGGFGQVGFFLTIGFMLFALPQLNLVQGNELAGIVLIFIYMMSPMLGLFNMITQMMPATVALQKVESLGLSLNQNLSREQPRLEPANNLQSLVLSGITHTYFNERQDEQFTLGPIDLQLGPGEVVYLVGGNGSGKSTLAKVITGLYEPEGGQLTLNGRAIDATNREWLRQHFSTVFTDFHLFSQFLGLDDPDTGDKVQSFLERLHLEKKVSYRGGRLSTTDLSTGQRKRLALLVTYLEDRPIYLFDEWASDQDPQFKETFYKELIPDLKRRGKTVLAITHDDRYFHLADRILKLEDGRLKVQT